MLNLNDGEGRDLRYWRAHPEQLDKAMRLLLQDELYSLRHQAPPPRLWTEVGNDAVSAWYPARPAHPRANGNHARERRCAALVIMS
ncbi:MAG: hypothetical protein HY816_03710 [Candidatus Wallbacteria bacterium]|nr:hypothetical protein [Candidatus Wallbacteria bacterium]